MGPRTLTKIWNHPRTSAAGLLVGLASVGSLLSRQGITLGKAGTGTVVSLATGIATVLPRPARQGSLIAAGR